MCLCCSQSSQIFSILPPTFELAYFNETIYAIFSHVLLSDLLSFAVPLLPPNLFVGEENMWMLHSGIVAYPLILMTSTKKKRKIWQFGYSVILVFVWKRHLGVCIKPFFSYSTSSHLSFFQSLSSPSLFLTSSTLLVFPLLPHFVSCPSFPLSGGVLDQRGDLVPGCNNTSC